MTICIIGNGYLAKRCKDAWENAVLATEKIYTVEQAEAVLKKYAPDVVLNAAGVTGRPNVDWCEEQPRESMLGNVIEPIVLAEACRRAGIYLLHMGSGCIFYGASGHPDGAWRESDFGNPVAVYSKHKYAADLALSTLPQVGIARIRMPVDSRPSPRNLIDKLARYKKIIDVENSVTIVDDMLPALHALLKQRAEGIFHVTNPGTVTHREILALYTQYVDPHHMNEWINEDDLVRGGLATKKRSNNFLASERLATFGIVMRDIHEALKDTMQQYARAVRENV